jgi:hypothetical protein
MLLRSLPSVRVLPSVRARRSVRAQQWSRIAGLVQGRTAHAIKNRYNLIQRWQKSLSNLDGGTDVPGAPGGLKLTASATVSAP